ncbi:hypothetical protein SASPL_118628 [Salvia splendens]|uniref:Nucleolar protein 9 n=1 Tax=Salvia splendens TaxID=180675 RepID=A0A8X8ZZA7_SALSN|nr:hypothetical protein SASPL_118628 [Salvia splendens]
MKLCFWNLRMVGLLLEMKIGEATASRGGLVELWLWSPEGGRHGGNQSFARSRLVTPSARAALCVEVSGMVSVGFRALALRNHNSHSSSQNGLITEQGGGPGATGRARNFFTGQGRLSVDPDTAKYFSEITNPEAKKWSLQLIISLATLCKLFLKVARLCSFLRSSADEFSQICMDRSGSHVAETALKSLARHLEDAESHPIIEETLSVLCETALKLLAGQEEELFLLIRILLGCPTDAESEESFIEVKIAKKVRHLVEENVYCHLMEVILAVAPDTVYNDIFTKSFKNSLFRLSSHFCGNFVIQALISHARGQEHIKLIFEELGPKFRDLLELGRAGVVAALVAASQRLQCNLHECCQALADAVCLSDESSACIVPRLLFLENYLYSVDKENWSWPSGFKMHVLGSLMLQSIFRYPSRQKILLGPRVIEAFLVSSISAKQKYEIVGKLRGHFGELAVLPSGTFTIEKCFNACNLSMKETIVSELLSFQAELSKSRQGPYLLKKLDVEGFARRPEQWRSRLTSKESVFTEFYKAFGKKDAKSSRGGNFLSDSYKNTQAEKFKGIRKEIDDGLSTGFISKSGTPFLAHQGSTKVKKSGDHISKVRGFSQDNNDDFSKSKKHKTSKDGESAKNEKKRRKKDGLSESSNKKLQAGISD